MTKQTIQKTIINLAGGLLIGAFVFYILKLIPFYPHDVQLPLALGSAVVWLINPIAGIFAALGILIIPITYVSLTLTIILLMFLLIVAVFEAWAVGPYGFLVLAGMVVLILHPELHFLLLTIPLLAGFLGTRRGAFLAGFAAFLALALGVVTGKQSMGVLHVWRTTNPHLSLHTAPSGELFGSGWLTAQVQNGLVDDALFKAVMGPFGDHAAMLAQIALWALAAGLMGAFISKPLIKKISAPITAAIIGMLVLAAGALLLPKTFSGSFWVINNLWLSILVPLTIACAGATSLKKLASIMTPVRRDAGDKTKNEDGHWSGITGLEQRQKEISGIIDAVFRPQNRKNGNPVTRGMLLFGPPGTEKIKLARGIADEAKATLISVNRNDLTTKYYDVFVSYSTRDKVATDQVVEFLEKNKIRCWYAPRDIPPNANWGKEVTNAIDLSKMVLLVFSSNSNHSQRVLDEINYAISKEMQVLPFRIENAAPTGALMLHLSSRHWLNAFDPSWKDFLDDLNNLVSSMLESVSNATQDKEKAKEVDFNNYLRQIFNEAKEKHPSVLFFEELSDFASAVDPDKTGAEIDTTDTFLECVDQLAAMPEVMVLAATEHPEKIDAAAFEPGRLDRQFYLPPLDRAACRNILMKHLAEKPIAYNVDFNKLCSLLEGYALADVEAIGMEAADLAESTRGTKQKPLGMVDLEKVIKSRKPTYSPEQLAKYETFAAEHGCLAAKPAPREKKPQPVVQD